MREHLDAEGLAEELAGDGAGRDAGGGLAGAGPLQYRSGVVEFVLEHAGVVGVAGPRPGQRRVARDLSSSAGVDRVRGHHGLPLGPLGVADLDGDRPAERDAVAHARQHGDLVALELHPGAAAVAEAAAGQLVGDVVGGDRQPGDHAFDHGHQSSAVGFTSSSPSQHESHLPTTGIDKEKRACGSVGLPIGVIQSKTLELILSLVNEGLFRCVHEFWSCREKAPSAAMTAAPCTARCPTQA